MKARHRTLYVDATQGASGDMLLGALIDLGVPVALLRRSLASLPIDGWSLRSSRIVRCGLVGRRVDVRVREEAHGRTWRELRRIVRAGELPSRARERALAVFRRLIEAEATVHGVSPERVHLHEAGGTDAIVDVVGTCVALDHLAPDRIVVSALTTGHGEIRCEHGVYPVPAPATALLIRGVPARGGDLEVERLTPTGAALLTALADDFGPLPLVRPVAVGYGAGQRDLGEVPNMLRLILGESVRDGSALDAAETEVAVLECTVDESTPQALAYASRLLLEAGALEVFTAAVTMKKGRVGHHLTVLGRPEHASDLARLVLRETSSLGLRFRVESRLELDRSVERVRTRYGTVGIKVGYLDGRPVQAWPEYDDCVALAEHHGTPLREVQRAALDAWAATGPDGKRAPGRSKVRARAPRA